MEGCSGQNALFYRPLFLPEGSDGPPSICAQWLVITTAAPAQSGLSSTADMLALKAHEKLKNGYR